MTNQASEVPVVVNGKKLLMEHDMGAAISFISDHTRRSLFPDLPLRDSSLTLRTYTEEQIEVVGQLNVRIKYGDQVENLVLVVVGGRNWLK